MDAVNAQRPTLHGAPLREVGDGRAVLRLHHDAPPAQRGGERSVAIAHECRLFLRLGDVHGNREHREPLAPRELRDGLVQRAAHGIWRMRRDARDKLRSCKTAKWADSGVELRHACRALRRVWTKYFLVDDPATTEVVECAHDGAGAAGFRNAGDAPRPAVADAGERRLVKRLRAGGLLELTNAADPREEFSFLVLHATTQVGELEVRVAVDETRHELGIAKLDRLSAARGRDARVRADGGDPAVCVNKNGAVLEGRRRDGMDPASSNAEQELGCDSNTER